MKGVRAATVTPRPGEVVLVGKESGGGGGGGGEDKG